MSQPPAHSRDPIGWCLAITLAFWALCLVRLGIPGKPYFDEVHYLPAARDLLALHQFTNREHPLLGKEILAAGIALFGDDPRGWRLLPSMFGAFALFAASRALWFASLSRFATLSYALLLATGFALFVHSRIAMLDIFMVAFLALAFWQCAAAMREAETGRRRLAIAGGALGLAIAAKWNALALAPVAGIAFFVLRWRAGRRRLFTSRRGQPVPGVSLLEAALWLGAVPLAVYAITFAPGWFFAIDRMSDDIVEHHRLMLDLQTQVLASHTYQSRWPDWVLNIRAIWYLYEPVDGAQRGILLIGNPLTMLLGLPAVAWAAWAGSKGNHAAAGVATLYAVSLGFWIVAAKPVQFYYHYFLPSCFLLAALALALDEMWRRGLRMPPLFTLAASTAVFAWFYPILSAAPLEGPESFADWMWLESWR